MKIQETEPRTTTDVLDYKFDFSPFLLASGDTITSAIFSISGGSTLAVISKSIVGNVVVVWIQGGTSGVVYKVTCTITTNSSPARVVTRSMYIPCTFL